MLKKLTDKQVAENFYTTERNLQQTYKNPKPTKQKMIITDTKLQQKQEQYEIIRLGSTCKEYKISEELLIKIIDFVVSIRENN